MTRQVSLSIEQWITMREVAMRRVALWRLRPVLMLPHRVVDKLERTIKK